MTDSRDGRTGRLAGRLIGLGVTGSIAAYKAVELLRLLRAEGADVAVMLTPSATRFVGPLSFAALSRHPVETELLELMDDGRIGLRYAFQTSAFHEANGGVNNGFGCETMEIAIFEAEDIANQVKRADLSTTVR